MLHKGIFIRLMSDTALSGEWGGGGVQVDRIFNKEVFARLQVILIFLSPVLYSK